MLKKEKSGVAKEKSIVYGIIQMDKDKFISYLYIVLIVGLVVAAFFQAALNPEAHEASGEEPSGETADAETHNEPSEPNNVVVPSEATNSASATSGH